MRATSKPCSGAEVMQRRRLTATAGAGPNPAHRHPGRSRAHHTSPRSRAGRPCVWSTRRRSAPTPAAPTPVRSTRQAQGLPAPRAVLAAASADSAGMQARPPASFMSSHLGMHSSNPRLRALQAGTMRQHTHSSANPPPAQTHVGVEAHSLCELEPVRRHAAQVLPVHQGEAAHLVAAPPARACPGGGGGARAGGCC